MVKSGNPEWMGTSEPPNVIAISRMAAAAIAGAPSFSAREPLSIATALPRDSADASFTERILDGRA